MPATVQAARRGGGGGGRRPPPPRGPAGAPEPRERRQPPQRSDLRRALHRGTSGCAEPTCASIPQSALAAAITEGGSWAGEGGRHLRASRPAHPGHESAASTTHVASPAAPSARQLRRTNLRKRTAVSPADGNQTGRERGWGQGDGRLRGVSWLGRTNRPGVEWRGEARPNRGGSSSQTRRQSRRAAGRHGRRA